jgi:FecR protein
VNQKILPGSKMKEKAMKKWKMIVSLIVLLLVCFTSAQAKPPMTVKMTKGEAKVTLLSGNAEVLCPGDKEARNLKVYESIKAGCEVSTGTDSKIEIFLPDKSIVRFAEKTKFKFVQIEVSASGNRAVEISVTVGKVWTNIRKSLTGKDDKFEVSCHNAVAGVRGTVYRMDVESDQSGLVKVYEGEVRVASFSRPQQLSVSSVGALKPVAGPSVVEGPKPVSMEQWVYIVRSMQKIHISSDGKAREPETFSETEDMDEWVKWNKIRDQKKH